MRNFWFKTRGASGEAQPLPAPDELARRWRRCRSRCTGAARRSTAPGTASCRSRSATTSNNDGLSYTAIWSIGCPFHCTYCGNTKFIANDIKYKRIRHPSARYMVDQIKDVRARSPQIEHVNFQDDSFMAIPYPQLEEFAELWKAELDLPFAVYGVIPNYVKKDKFEILTWAGMNRIRMGIQSGSEHILEFYKRPSPPVKIRRGRAVIGEFAARAEVPPAAALRHHRRQPGRDPAGRRRHPRAPVQHAAALQPADLLAQSDPEHGARAGDEGARRSTSRRSLELHRDPPQGREPAPLRAGVVASTAPVFDFLLRRVQATSTPQREYPMLGTLLRTLYLSKRVVEHLRFMDFSIIPGWSGYVA